VTIASGNSIAAGKTWCFQPAGSLNEWKVVPPIEREVLVVPSSHEPNAVPPMFLVVPLNHGVEPEKKLVLPI